MKTPIAFLIFNRPDTTKKVFEVIRQAQPSKLLIVADGPRPDRPTDLKKCADTRAIVNCIDWDCEVLTNYSEINLGCKQCVSSGLNWVFNLVEEAIILEDDCVPHPTFFPFCEELLDRYRNDERIMVIAGDNFQLARQRTKYSYYFSRYPHCWGWATWRRAWKYYDKEMKLWPEIRDENWLDSVLEDPEALEYWTQIFQTTYENRNNSWAYSWGLSCWVQSGLTILPNVNLITNIGFDVESTNTVNRESPLANLPIQEMYFPLQHPPFVMRHAEADRFTQNSVFRNSLLGKVQRKIKKFLLTK